jgi:hypothetical protein
VAAGVEGKRAALRLKIARSGQSKAPAYGAVEDLMELKIKADFANYQRKLDWVSGLLKSSDVRERLDGSLLSRLHDLVAGTSSEEIAKLGAVTASGTCELTVDVDGGRLLEDVIFALGTLGFKFHGEAPCS